MYCGHLQYSETFTVTLVSNSVTLSDCVRGAEGRNLFLVSEGEFIRYILDIECINGRIRELDFAYNWYKTKR